MKILQKLVKGISNQSIMNLKRAVLSLLCKIGLNELFRIINKKKLIILSYHGISDRANYLDPYQISKSTFKKHIFYLKEKNYKFITLDDWINIRGRNKKPKYRYVVLSFDDGFKNVIENAYPIMKKYEAKGCIYIISDMIGNNEYSWFNFVENYIRGLRGSEFKFTYKNKEILYPLSSKIDLKKTISDIQTKIASLNNSERSFHLQQFMEQANKELFQKAYKDYSIANWSEIKSLDNKILEIGSHSKSHPYLEIINDYEELSKELYGSKLKIEKEVGISIKHFCYPHGSYKSKIIKLLKKYDYSTAVTINRGLNTVNTDLFQLKRIVGYDDFLLFKTNISGLFPFLRKLLEISSKN